MDANSDNPGNAAGTEERDGHLMNAYDRSLKLAFEMHNAGRQGEAESLCRVLRTLRPQDAQLLFLLGMVLHRTGRNAEAVKWLALAAQYQPQSARIFGGLGCACRKLGDHARATAAFQMALRLEPKSSAVEFNLGNTCYKLGQVEPAATHFRNLVEKNPRDAAGWNNLGKCLKELNRLDESLAAYNRALEIAPDYTLARYGRGITLLSAGRLREGFQDYEARWHQLTPRQFPRPVWTGEPAPNRTLLVYAEQGFGDAIQMIRFVPAARQRVGRVILECRPELFTLFQHSKCADVIVPHGAKIPPFDFRLPLLSLPRVLGVTLETIPHRAPYLQAPPRARPLPAPPEKRKVGLVWAGNPEHHQDALRSLRLEQLAPILAAPDAAFYSLQQPVPAADQNYLRAVSPAVFSGLKFADFLETAAVVAEMDLIISADTAVAHLAGALGRPVWLLLQHSADWRWLLDRSDSPWYPTARLFRQGERGRWDVPVQSVVKALQKG